MWSDSVYYWKEYDLLRELIDNDQDCVIARWEGEHFDEIHGDCVLGSFRDWKLFEWSVWLVVLRFGSYASNTRVTEILNIYAYRWPSVSAIDKF